MTFFPFLSLINSAYILSTLIPGILSLAKSKCDQRCNCCSVNFPFLPVNVCAFPDKQKANANAKAHWVYFIFSFDDELELVFLSKNKRSELDSVQ